MATDIGIIHKIDIDKEMRGAYLDYAMSVIVSRALPDVRDGLKPVHRRILYAMHSMGLRHDKPHRKSARIVGEVLGKFHPHGDAAVYDAMVRMAQDFSMRYPLVDGQGNFGSIDGDSAAAMRYTEARLAAIAETMIADLEKDTVDWGANFDDTLNEPQVMPAALPNLLLNGSSGIAVGMATNIPPHNLGEIVDALAFVIDHYHAVEDISLEHLMQFVKGPDFPTGGIVYRYRADKDGHEDVITKAYAGGRGRLIVQAKVHVEAMSRNRNRLVITELPYQTNKTRLIERIAELVRDGRVEGITDLRDESDRQGMRIAIELTRNVEPKDILETLYKYTPMQQTFGVNMLALVDGQPRLLSLKRLLLLYLEHRREIVRRRSEYDLAKARERAHILEGLLIALANLDDVIATIRRSPDTDTARIRLMRKFKLSQVQTQAILDMPLKRLSRLERDKLKDEHKQLLGQIADLEYLLAHPQKMLTVIKEELLALKEQYNDSRRTQIVDKQGLALTTGELLDDQEVLVLLTKKGLFFQQSLAGRRRGSLPRRVADAAIVMAAAPARDSVFLFTAAGQAVQQRIHQIPGEEGVHFSEITDLQPDDEVVAMLALPVPDDETPSQHSLLLVTRTGRCKRIAISELWAAAHTSPLVMNVEADDALVSAVLCDTDDDILLATRLGQSIRFAQDEVRVMGLPAGGVLGMKLSPGDQVVGADMGKADRQVLLLTTEGYGVRTPVDKYPRQKRHGSGVLAMRLTQKHGAVESFAVVDEEPEMFVIGRTGAMRVLRLGDVPAGGRGVRGRQIVGLKDADLQKLLVIVIPKVKEEDDPPPPPLPPPPPKRPSRTSSGRSTRSKASTSSAKAPAKAAGTARPAAAESAAKTTRGRKPAGGAATKPAAKPTPAATKSAAKTTRGRKTAGGAATKPAAKPTPAATK
ncbi:MAG: DNA gyrase subunit A, partial [Chloroflexi bacterium]|nr:DNA gyrase subunit A [Chloroflexota bacterium]